MTTIAFIPVEPQSHKAQATTLERLGMREPAGGVAHAGHSIQRHGVVYHCRMPVPSPSPDARAVVTGASQGIGEALATELAARGHSLIITARREEVLTELAARLADRYGVAVEVRPVDLTDATERTKLADELATRNISILCNNAGTATFGPVSTLDPAGREGSGGTECHCGA